MRNLNSVSAPPVLSERYLDVLSQSRDLALVPEYHDKWNDHATAVADQAGVDTIELIVPDKIGLGHIESNGNKLELDRAWMYSVMNVILHTRHQATSFNSLHRRGALGGRRRDVLQRSYNSFADRLRNLDGFEVHDAVQSRCPDVRLAPVVRIVPRHIQPAERPLVKGRYTALHMLVKDTLLHER